MAGIARKSDPALWDRVKSEITEGDKGGKPGQWSARKAQMAAQEYQRRGGGYLGRKAADNHLDAWTDEAWGTRSGQDSLESGERYLPRAARAALSPEEYDRSTAAKRRDLRQGRQYSAQPDDVAAKAAAVRKQRRGRAQQAKGHGMDEQEDTTARAFRELVNMRAAALRDWLETEDSRNVGWTHEGEDEAVGHQSGRKILEILERGAPDAEDADFLEKVVGYIRRHLAQRPEGDVSETRWRYSLMNWGHDPLQGGAGRGSGEHDEAGRDDDQAKEEHAMQDESPETTPAEEPVAEEAPRRRRASTGRSRRSAAATDGETKPRNSRRRSAATTETEAEEASARRPRRTATAKA
ncbi:MAG: DUF3140 domain-containing protein, partial [Paracraurococcus sp.]